MASAPGSPWGGGEGLAKFPWSDLLTTRMLAQRFVQGNASKSLAAGQSGGLPTLDFQFAAARFCEDFKLSLVNKFPWTAATASPVFAALMFTDTSF